MAWLYGPIAAGAPVVEIGLAGHGRLLLRGGRSSTMVVAMTNGGPSPGPRSSPSATASRTIAAAASASAIEG